jgi:hypothetical protein
VFGWIWPKLRRWNLITLGLTAFSWLLMGLWYGIGYCVCTDLHYRVRDALGVKDPSGSYLQLLVWKLSGWWPPETMVNTVAGWVFGSSVVLSVAFNVRDMIRKRRLVDASCKTRH